MSPLAHEIYRQLLRHLRAGNPSITYGELAQKVSKKLRTHQRSPHFHAALGELTVACRANALPSMPAAVWRASARRPGEGYYAIAHPRARTEEARVAAWEREHAAVLSAMARYPVELMRLERV
ncbi:MAG TPA: hypothetical protein VM513_25335 [Kofleriaceae bacterium]|nr:hypothetical protein [Kofleriaceae bacterium]